jgi:hypothetical protein
VSVGVTPTTGLHLRGSFIDGPYLSRHETPALPAGADWKDYKQRAWGSEIQFSRGYFELNTELASTRYDVPEHDALSRGRVWYIEPKYTWTPRLFTAVRIECARLPYIEVEDEDEWESKTLHLADVEAGVGYRLAPQLVLKVSYRADRWRVDDEERPSHPDGHALALQLSYGFDVRSWLSRPR